MKPPFHPFARRDPRPVLAGLMEVLRSRGAEADWHEEDCRDHFVALVGGDGGLEVHVFLGRDSIPRLGRIILFQAIHPMFPTPRTLGRLSMFGDRSNEVLYGAKLYLRKAPGDPSVVQLVVERGVLVGEGDLFRLADEFDLFVTEYHFADERLNTEFPGTDPLSQAKLLGLLDGPVVENC